VGKALKFHREAVPFILFLFLIHITVLFVIALDPNHTLYAISAMPQQIGDQQVQNVTFRLLAVEAYTHSDMSPPAQRLIKNLKLFGNWINGTVSAGFQYFSHVHLLSNIKYEDIDPECQPYYRGDASRANVINEVNTFLNLTLPKDNETLSILVFYYAGYSNKAVSQGKTSYYMALDKPLFDWELNQTLPPNGDQTSTIIILDTSYSGGYIAKLALPGRVILVACSPEETPSIGWFTGHENASYPNGTNFGPLGIIGGFQVADDVNNDGWLSAAEIFDFAWRSLTCFAANQTNAEVNNSYGLHPWASYGVAGGGVPFVQRNGSKPFPGNAKACVPRAVLPTSSRYDWRQFEYPMYRQSLNRTGFASTIGPKKPELLWVSSLNSSIVSSTVVADGMVFVGTSSGTFYALDMTTGKVVWSFFTNSPVSSSPAVKDGTVFFGTENPGKIYALDAFTALVRWVYEIPTGAGVYSSPAIVSGLVFVGCSDGYLRCFSEFEGELIWATYVGGGKLSSPAIVDNIAFITSPHVYAVDIFTGKLIWEYQTNWPVFSSPTVADRLVFVGTENDDKVFALEQSSGKIVWSFWTGGWLTSPAVDDDKNLVIVGCRDARVYCLSERTGFLKWQYIAAPNHLSAPTISKNGLIYIGSSDENLYCLNEETGEEVWKFAVGSPIASSPSVVYEHVIVASQEGKIFCFGPQFPSHNIAVFNVTASPLKLRAGKLLEVSYTVKNNGNVEETFELAICQNSSNVWVTPECLEPTTIHNYSFVFSVGADLTYTYYWNTSDANPGFYSISIRAYMIPDETDASDNTFILDGVLIIALEDLNADGKINIIDISMAARAYGSLPDKPNWNPDADLNNDNLINILDISLIAKGFGKIYA
jgi:outer membrane protein assembly factor BamB